jgi:hypothetical protein
MSLLLEQLNDESIEMEAILLVQNQISTTIKTQSFIITKNIKKKKKTTQYIFFVYNEADDRTFNL